MNKSNIHLATNKKALPTDSAFYLFLLLNLSSIALLSTQSQTLHQYDEEAREDEIEHESEHGDEQDGSTNMIA